MVSSTLPFLQSELICPHTCLLYTSIPSIREGGDRGLPVTLAGPKSPQATAFYDIAGKLMVQAEAAAAAASDVIEIS